MLRVLLTAVAGVLYAAGWLAGKARSTAGWLAAAVRAGYRDAVTPRIADVAPEPGPIAEIGVPRRPAA